MKIFTENQNKHFKKTRISKQQKLEKMQRT